MENVSFPVRRPPAIAAHVCETAQTRIDAGDYWRRWDVAETIDFAHL